MPVSECYTCGGHLYWKWEEACEKFGFGDGDGQVETWNVESVLVDAGYEVTVDGWGLHNTVITSIKKEGVDLHGRLTHFLRFIAFNLNPLLGEKRLSYRHVGWSNVVHNSMQNLGQF